MSTSKVCFRNLLLQDTVARQLSYSFSSGRIAQTYLFAGSESTGRLPAARSFAALLQCEKPVTLDGLAADACGVCESCRRIAGDSHPDVTVIRPDGTEIRIDQVRALQETAALKPGTGRWLIFILDPADRLNQSSANSLLKILEEAPSHVVFILIARETGAILPTVLSRSEIVRFASPSPSEIRAVLAEKHALSAEAAAICCSLSEGRLGQSLLLAEFSLAETVSPGLKYSHANFLNAIEATSRYWQDIFAGATSLEDALRLAARPCHEFYPPLLANRKEFCRSLIMAVALPASFPILFADMLTGRLDSAVRAMQKSFEPLLAEAKKAYPAAVLKDVEGAIDSLLHGWSGQQLEELLLCLLNWHSDALKVACGADESLLLNLDRKEDIITLAAVDDVALLRAQIELVGKSVGLLRRHVQPALVIENLITQIGGLEP
ncbi:MAG: DNA polymerase III subunit delta' [Candidatus Riflebacteria bacterium HGW-Riflebacteria-2]|nr:MAG: DNA polymerase III subunit delta' [Candidatus Riflebacteria bacterium HGW-Riflebacteria-2]